MLNVHVFIKVPEIHYMCKININVPVPVLYKTLYTSMRLNNALVADKCMKIYWWSIFLWNKKRGSNIGNLWQTIGPQFIAKILTFCENAKSFVLRSSLADKELQEVTCYFNNGPNISFWHRSNGVVWLSLGHT